MFQQMIAPPDVELIVTVCEGPYVPPSGLNVGESAHVGHSNSESATIPLLMLVSALLIVQTGAYVPEACPKEDAKVLLCASVPNVLKGLAIELTEEECEA